MGHWITRQLPTTQHVCVINASLRIEISRLRGNDGQTGLEITGQTEGKPIFHGAANFHLELIDSQTLDDSIQEFTYTAALHV